MIGPLPRAYRVLVTTAALLFFVVAGLWVAQALGLPLPARGALAGGVVGVLAAYVLVTTSRTVARPARSP